MRLGLKKLPLVVSCLLGLTVAPLHAADVEPDTAAVVPAEQAASADTWLMRHLPAATDTYVRVPPVWSLLLADGAGQPAALAQAWSTLHPALLQWFLAGVPEGTRPLLTAFVNDAGSALEVAVVGALSAQPQVYATVVLDGQSPAAIDTMIASALLSDGADGAQVDVRTSRAGEGTVLEDGKPVLSYRFHADDGRLLLVFQASDAAVDWQWSGKQTDAALLAQLEALQGDADHVFVWQKNQPVLAMGVSMRQPLLMTLGLLDLRSMSLSSAQHDGHYAAWLGLDMPDTGIRALFPSSESDVTLRTQGQPQWALLLSPPSAAAVERFMQDSGSGRDYQNLKQELLADQGIDLDVLFNAAAAQWLLFADDNGQFAALDAAAETTLNEAIEMLKKAGWITTDEAVGHGIRHLSIANKLFADMDEESEAVPRLLQRLLTTPNDVYLKNEGDYLLMAGLPQPLLARAQASPDTSMQDWLNRAGVDVQRSSFAYVFPVRHLAQQHYYGSLRYLQQMGHVAGQPVDMMTLPSAQALALPPSGLLAFDVVNHDNALTFNLRSPHDLSDWLYADKMGMTTVVTAGILAGIAIPAYQDYMLRSKVVRAYQEAVSILNPQVAQAGSLAQLSEAQRETLQVQTIMEADAIRQMDIGDDAVTLFLNDHLPSVLNGAALVLRPDNASGRLHWQCSFDRPYLDRYLPAACRP